MSLDELMRINNQLLKEIRNLLVIIVQKKPTKEMVGIVEKIKKEIEEN